MSLEATGPVLLPRDSHSCTHSTREPLDSTSLKTAVMARRQGLPHLTVKGSRLMHESVGAPSTMATRAQTTQDRANQLGTAHIHARRPSSESGPSAHITAERPLGVEGIVLVPRAASTELNPEDYLTDGMSHAQMTFHGAAKGESTTFFRTVDLSKKNDKGDPEVDEERQVKVDKQFIQIKHLLGLGNCPSYGLSKLPANYSVTYHELEVFSENGEVRYFDLKQPEHIEELLKWRQMDSSPENIEKVSQELLEIQKELQSLTETEAGEYESTFVQDCLGNLNGPAPFALRSNGLYHTAKNPHLYMHTPTMLKRGLLTAQSRFGRSDKHTLTPQGKKAMTQMREARILQKIAMTRYGMEISAKMEQLKRLEYVLASSPDSYKATHAEIQELQNEIGELRQMQAELAQASTMAVDFLLLTLNGTMPSHGLSAPATGQDFLHMEIDREASGIPLPVEGDAVATERSERLTDVRRHDYIDFMADQVGQDFSRTIVDSNQPIFPRFRKSKTHELTSQEREFSAMLGNHLYELERGAPSLDPIRMRKRQQLQKHGVLNVPQTDRAVDFLLYAGLHSDNAKIRGYKDHPLMQECLDLYLDKREGLQALYSPTSNFDIEVRRLKKLDSKTDQAIQAAVKEHCSPTPPTPRTRSPSVSSSEPLSPHNSTIPHI